jgi:hypothetical protein
LDFDLGGWRGCDPALIEISDSDDLKSQISNLRFAFQNPDSQIPCAPLATSKIENPKSILPLTPDPLRVLAG